MDTIRVLQIITFVISLSGVWCAIRFIRQHPDQWYWMLPPLTWLVHLEIFYIFVFCRVFLGINFNIDFTLWSAWLRLNVTFILAGLLWLISYDMIKIRQSGETPEHP